MPFALFVRCKKTTYCDGSVAVSDGNWALVEEDLPDHWVEATATLHSKTPPPINGRAKVFKTRAAAENFGKKWTGHPWWIVPGGEVKAVEVTKKYRRVFDGYKSVEGEAHQ